LSSSSSIVSSAKVTLSDNLLPGIAIGGEAGTVNSLILAVDTDFISILVLVVLGGASIFFKR
jgi:hypothetical protein